MSVSKRLCTMGPRLILSAICEQQGPRPFSTYDQHAARDKQVRGGRGYSCGLLTKHSSRMYETPSRANARRLAGQQPASDAVSRLSRLSTRSSASLVGAAPAQHFVSPVAPGPAALSPSTPQSRQLRKPASMAQLGRRVTPRRPSAADVYKGRIHVGVRARPSTGSGAPWRLDPRANVVAHDSAGVFTFDRVFDGAARNEHVFEESVAPLVRQVVDGFNATVLAYGTTGSGKTYTMQGLAEDQGVIPRSVTLLFDLLGPACEVVLSYFEIYNERVYDLLSEDSEPSEVSLRDGNSGETAVVGHREVMTGSAEELLGWVASGDQLRRTSSTQYNEHSSRSHAVVRIGVRTQNTQSVFYLCDLAGSERAVVHTERRREGSFINKSLLTLSTVISILSQGGGAHVPYRDSKLTRLLQPSLAGTALVSLVCTIHPHAVGSSTETLNSVRFAAKAKNVAVTATRGTVFAEAGLSGANLRLLDHLQQENETLRRELMKERTEREDLVDRLKLLEQAADHDTETSLEAMTGISFDDSSAESPKAERLATELERVRAENAELNQRITHLVSEITALDTNFARLETAARQGASTAADSAFQEENEGLRAQIHELEEQLRDKSLALDCLTQMNQAGALALPEEFNIGNTDSLAPTGLDGLAAESIGERVNDMHLA